MLPRPGRLPADRLAGFGGRDVLMHHECARQAAESLLTEADGIDEMYKQPRPFLMPLFTQVPRRRGVLRSSYLQSLASNPTPIRADNSRLLTTQQG